MNIDFIKNISINMKYVTSFIMLTIIFFLIYFFILLKEKKNLPESSTPVNSSTSSTTITTSSSDANSSTSSKTTTTADAAEQIQADLLDIPRVLIIGDSVSIGYTRFLQKLLNDDEHVQVLRIMKPPWSDPIKESRLNRSQEPMNAQDTEYGIEKIEFWLSQFGGIKWDLIYFNFGLHDIKHVDIDGVSFLGRELGGEKLVHPLDYQENLKILTERLKQSTKQLVWNNITPIPVGSRARYNEDAVNYNRIASIVMGENDIPTLDLYNPSFNNMSDWMLEENVHFKDEGYKALAEIIAEDILERVANDIDYEEALSDYQSRKKNV
tara:strand:- start:417 stop:1388 length:972 start_codon:yes stop_codon:yes gene_type:complete